ncbi:MAG: hypothetical protein EAZ77_09365 [Nostocales cyanobacterium]|nr:MAG: hypothetical protein EAZ77_09365 [Nostocales cyanobacterium]
MKLKNLIFLLPLVTSLVSPLLDWELFNSGIALGKTDKKQIIKGSCGKEKCETLFQKLNNLYPEYTNKYAKECPTNQILGLAIYKDDQDKKIYFTCWNSKKEKDGNRYGSYLGSLPTPGNEKKFLTPLPTNSPDNQYHQYLQKNYANELKKAQFRCATNSGNFKVLTSEAQKTIQLQCYFQAGVNFMDVNNDWVSDGEATRGAGVDQILGTFPMP